jgi:DMSO/TMAO reductase YedYZ molybdopterin-dependent catalytic subunit
MLNRRVFLEGSLVAVAGAVVARRHSLAGDPARADTIVSGKDPRLIVHTEAPAVFETPAALLADRQVTPAPLVFVRNNSQPADAATMKPPRAEGWKIELAGRVDRPQSINVQALGELRQIDEEMVLQCSGNSRSLFSAAAPVSGTPWGRGGMADVRFAGVPLSAVVERLKIKIEPEAKFLTVEGADSPPPGEQDFEHSIPLDEVLKKSLLALRMNGEPLPAIHGGPVRLVIPGYYGTMHVKWVTRLRFDERESDHTSQIPHYRTPLVPIKPGEKLEFTFANSEPNWRMKIKSVVLVPEPGARLPAGETIVKGVAFNDGEARIDSVLVSPDGGNTWRPARLEVPPSPYAWYRWETRLDFRPGRHQIWARAIDVLGRTQPTDGAIHWNPRG